MPGLSLGLTQSTVNMVKTHTGLQQNQIYMTETNKILSLLEGQPQQAGRVIPTPGLSLLSCKGNRKKQWREMTLLDRAMYTGPKTGQFYQRRENRRTNKRMRFQFLLPGSEPRIKQEKLAFASAILFAHVGRSIASILTLSAPASLSTSIFSLQHQYKINCFVVRI